MLNGKLDINERIKRLSQRKYITKQMNQEIENEIFINDKILEVLNKPRVSLDSIGMFVLSGRTPEEYLESL